MSAAKVAATWKSDLMPALLAALVALAINAWMGPSPLADAGGRPFLGAFGKIDFPIPFLNALLPV
ncbi:hypothetical protein EH240_33365 [Mesorhizobium tamadayense]|uniref:Uncharacterized protein n=1 Tax=Mesorhizobium tamadayense TaxID=425306 RepID=A0A3P3EVG1_9HYPH|nr:hypothetical protein [Mesorhizobium tamadayense]RRH90167.1 hypothetical protein EH240_33365 [Mesorhizobium tamadayense]